MQVALLFLCVCVCGLSVAHSFGIKPGGSSGPRVYQDQFRGFEYQRVYTSEDFFLPKNILAESERASACLFVILIATFAENRQAVGINIYDMRYT